MSFVPVGIGSAGVAAMDTATGKVYVSNYQPEGISGINWQLFADSFGKAWQPIAEGLKNKLSGPAYAGYGGYAEVAPYPPGGAYGQFDRYGASAGIDTNTLLLIGGIALVAFMFVKK